MLDKGVKLNVAVLAAFVNLGSSPVKHLSICKTLCM